MAATARPLSRSKGRRFIGSSPLRFQGVDDAVSGNRGDQAGSRAPLFCSSGRMRPVSDRKSTRLNSSHLVISYAVFCLKKKKKLTSPPERHNWPAEKTPSAHH